MAKQQKQVVVLARIEQNNCPQVCYKVRASEPLEIGEETEYPVYYNGRRYAIYTVRFVNCDVQSCDCPAYGNCYHKEQVQALEDARYADRRAILARYMALYMSIDEINTINKKYAVQSAMQVARRETDGLEDSGLPLQKVWKIRGKRAKVRQQENAKQYTTKLNAVKQESEVA